MAYRIQETVYVWITCDVCHKRADYSGDSRLKSLRNARRNNWVLGDIPEGEFYGPCLCVPCDRKRESEGRREG